MFFTNLQQKRQKLHAWKQKMMLKDSGAPQTTLQEVYLMLVLLKNAEQDAIADQNAEQDAIADQNAEQDVLVEKRENRRCHAFGATANRIRLNYDSKASSLLKKSVLHQK